MINNDFFEIQEFGFAINDLKVALKCGKYPEENQFKLYQRLSKVLESSGDFSSVITSYENLIKSLDLSKLKPEQKSQLKSEAVQGIRGCQKRLTLQSFTSFDDQNKFDAKYQFPFYASPHPRICNASDALSVVFTAAKGRHVVASRDIDVDECLIDEVAATQMTYLKNCLTHCYACLKNVVSPMPCDVCAAVVFCDEQCRQNAANRSD
jgi:hypothetical protein